MSYYDVITNVERKIEREQAYMELHRDGLFCSENLSTYEAIGYVKNVVVDTEKSGNSMTVISFEYEKPEGKIQAQSFRTNKEPDYYKDCKGKKVYLSGIIYGNCGKKKNKRIPILYVSSCYSVEDRQNIIETCETMTEDEKRSFQKKIQSFSLELQKDLSERCVALSKKRIPDKEEELPATYIEVEELDALFDMQKAVIPVEFRTEYNKCKRMLNKYLSGSEKKNYMSWLNDNGGKLQFCWYSNNGKIQTSHSLKSECVWSYILKNGYRYHDKSDNRMSYILWLYKSCQLPVSFTLKNIQTAIAAFETGIARDYIEKAPEYVSIIGFLITLDREDEDMTDALFEYFNIH